MAIPSGSGSEVLKVVYETYASGTVSLITSGANEIITILSIIVCETNNTEEELYLMIDAARNDVSGTAGQDIFLLYQTPIGKKQTFVWNDKFVFYGGDVLKFYAGSAGDMDITVSYIVQDWS